MKPLHSTKVTARRIAGELNPKTCCRSWVKSVSKSLKHAARHEAKLQTLAEAFEEQ